MPRNGSGSYSLPAGNPVTTGTTIASTWANNTLADLAAAITQSVSADGQTPMTGNLPMAGTKLTGLGAGNARADSANLGQVQDSGAQWLSGVAGTDTITAGISPAITAYAAGQTFRFVAAGTNTTNAVTLNISGVGAVAVKRMGLSGLVGLAPGDIPAGALVEVVYDGTQFHLVGLVAFDALGGPGGTPFTLRNKVINGAFSVNQMQVSGTVTLAAGVYGHDMWKGGVAGGTYTFATSNGQTTLTISAGSLQQVIESANVPPGANTMTMTWTGTAQGKIGAGAFSASGVTASVTGGANLTIEFNTGTLTNVQIEVGGATPFENRLFNVELALCERYLRKSFSYATAPAQNAGLGTGEFRFPQVVGASTSQLVGEVSFGGSRMRASPAITLYNPAASNAQVRSISASSDCSATSVITQSDTGFSVTATTPVGTAAGQQLGVHWLADARI